MMIILLQSNPSESWEFLSTSLPNFLKATGVISFIIILFLVCNAYWKKHIAPKLCEACENRSWLSPFIVAVSLVGCLLSAHRLYACHISHAQYWTRFTNGMNDATTPIVYDYAIRDAFFNPKMQSLDRLSQTIDNCTIDPSQCRDSLNIVFIVGESFSKHRSNLYGYPLSTNPELAKFQRDSSLLIFKDVFSPSNQTVALIGPLFSTADFDKPDEFTEYPLTPALFKKAGYRVGYYDNQSVIGKAANFDFGCLYFFSDESIRKVCYDSTNDRQYDYDDGLINNCPPVNIGTKNLTIYHLRGQHVKFKERFPKNFKRFDAQTYIKRFNYPEDQAVTMAEFDNATAYNDSVIGALIHRLEKSNLPTVLVYVPDHGEEAYDTRDQLGRLLGCTDDHALKIVNEVPLFVWMNKEFRNKYPQEVAIMRQECAKPIYNTDISHTLLDIAGIETPYLNKDLSLIREGGGRKSRKMLGVEYEKQRPSIASIKTRWQK